MKFLHCRFLLCSTMKTFTMSRSRAARMAARGQGGGAVADVRAGGAGCFHCTAGRGARSVDSGVGGLQGTAAA